MTRDLGPSSAPPEPGRWRTWANALTLIRLALAPACALSLYGGSAAEALLYFGLAVATDLADGRVARRRGEVSDLGALLDHATDAFFVSLGLAVLASRGQVPALLPALVLLAFAQYALDSRSSAGQGLRTSSLGRWNGIAYYVLLGTPIVRDALELAWPGHALLLALGWCLVASTLVSMAARARAWLFSRRARGWRVAERADRSRR